MMYRCAAITLQHQQQPRVVYIPADRTSNSSEFVPLTSESVDSLPTGKDKKKKNKEKKDKGWGKKSRRLLKKKKSQEENIIKEDDNLSIDYPFAKPQSENGHPSTSGYSNTVRNPYNRSWSGFSEYAKKPGPYRIIRVNKKIKKESVGIQTMKIEDSLQLETAIEAEVECGAEVAESGAENPPKDAIRILTCSKKDEVETTDDVIVELDPDIFSYMLDKSPSLTTIKDLMTVDIDSIADEDTRSLLSSMSGSVRSQQQFATIHGGIKRDPISLDDFTVGGAGVVGGGDELSLSSTHSRRPDSAEFRSCNFLPRPPSTFDLMDDEAGNDKEPLIKDSCAASLIKDRDVDVESSRLPLLDDDSSSLSGSYTVPITLRHPHTTADMMDTDSKRSSLVSFKLDDDKKSSPTTSWTSVNGASGTKTVLRNRSNLSLPELQKKAPPLPPKPVHTAKSSVQLPEKDLQNIPQKQTQNTELISAVKPLTRVQDTIADTAVLSEEDTEVPPPIPEKRNCSKLLALQGSPSVTPESSFIPISNHDSRTNRRSIDPDYAEIESPPLEKKLPSDFSLVNLPDNCDSKSSHDAKTMTLNLSPQADIFDTDSYPPNPDMDILMLEAQLRNLNIFTEPQLPVNAISQNKPIKGILKKNSQDDLNNIKRPKSTVSMNVSESSLDNLTSPGSVADSDYMWDEKYRDSSSTQLMPDDKKKKKQKKPKARSWLCCFAPSPKKHKRKNKSAKDDRKKAGDCGKDGTEEKEEEDGKECTKKVSAI